jgi:hypothetical protein
MDGDGYGIPRLLRKYLIAKAKHKFIELKKEAVKTKQYLRELLKRV